MKEKKIDRFFLIIVGLFACYRNRCLFPRRLESGRKMKKLFSVLFNQLVLGLGLGTIGMYFCYKINYKFWRRYSLLIFWVPSF